MSDPAPIEPTPRPQISLVASGSSEPYRRLAEEVSIQGYDTTVLSAIFHVVEHFSGHTYQIILITKHLTGEDLGFYAYLTRTGRKE